MGRKDKRPVQFNRAGGVHGLGRKKFTPKKFLQPSPPAAPVAVPESVTVFQHANTDSLHPCVEPDTVTNTELADVGSPIYLLCNYLNLI
jgi:hypothetical protein